MKNFMKTRKLFTVAAAVLFAVQLNGQLTYDYATDGPTQIDKPEVLMSTLGTTPAADEVELTGDVILTSGNVYIMDRRTYVMPNATLTIQPGTIIKATPEQSAATRALVVTRGAKIFAAGTEELPIVFTSVFDPMSDVTEGSSFSILNKELWGGLIVLGKAYNSIENGDENPEQAGTQIGDLNGLGFIEGLSAPDDRHWYGAIDWDAGADGDPATLEDNIPVFDDDDNSGILKYVSIRHGGTEIAPANEVNGLTLGSVGRGTTIEHIEVVSNGDDGIEFFGGTVNVKYINLLFNEDDYIDWDQGYTGKGQFLFCVALQPTSGEQPNARFGDNGFECDGDDGTRSLPGFRLSNPTFYNVTVLGDGLEATGSDKGLELKERTDGTIANSILARYEIGINIEPDDENSNAPTYPNDGLVLLNNLVINSTVWTNDDASYTTELIATGNEYIAVVNDLIDDTYELNTTGLATDAPASKRTNVVDSYDAVPVAGDSRVMLNNSQVAPADGFFVYAPYRGAFEPGTKSWLDSWSKMEDVKIDGVTVNCPTDIDGSGVTNADDYNALIGEFGKSCKIVSAK